MKSRERWENEVWDCISGDDSVLQHSVNRSGRTYVVEKSQEAQDKEREGSWKKRRGRKERLTDIFDFPISKSSYSDQKRVSSHSIDYSSRVEDDRREGEMNSHLTFPLWHCSLPLNSKYSTFLLHFVTDLPNSLDYTLLVPWLTTTSIRVAPNWSSWWGADSEVFEKIDVNEAVPNWFSQFRHSQVTWTHS